MMPKSYDCRMLIGYIVIILFCFSSLKIIAGERDSITGVWELVEMRSGGSSQASDKFKNYYVFLSTGLMLDSTESLEDTTKYKVDIYRYEYGNNLLIVKKEGSVSEHRVEFNGDLMKLHVPMGVLLYEKRGCKNKKNKNKK